MGGVAAVVFDFDGVIVESVELKNLAFGELFRASHPQFVEEIDHGHGLLRCPVLGEGKGPAAHDLFALRCLARRSVRSLASFRR